MSKQQRWHNLHLVLLAGVTAAGVVLLEGAEAAGAMGSAMGVGSAAAALATAAGGG